MTARPWTLVLLPRSTHARPLILDHPGPPPDRLDRISETVVVDPAADEIVDELPAYADRAVEQTGATPTVYVRRLTMPGEAAVYTVDDALTAQLSLVADRAHLTLAAAPITRDRERAVLDEEDNRLRAAIAEATPDLDKLERERNAITRALEAEAWPSKPAPRTPTPAQPCGSLDPAPCPVTHEADR